MAGISYRVNGHFERRIWEASPGAYPPLARLRRRFEYEAFVPDPIARREWSLPGHVVEDIVRGETAIAALGAWKTRRPVRVRLPRVLDMALTGKRHPFLARFEAGFDDEGRIQALTAALYSDAGWSLDLSDPIAWRALFHLDNAYYIPNLEATAAVCFLAIWQERPVAFSSWLPFVGRGVRARREHRTVTLPDYQGVGIGNALSAFVASLWKGLGCRALSTTTHPAMIAARCRSPLWRMTRRPSFARPGDRVLDPAALPGRDRAGRPGVGQWLGAGPVRRRAGGKPDAV